MDKSLELPDATAFRRLAWLLLGGVTLAVVVSLWLTAIRTGFWLPPLGVDFDLYRDAAVRWAETGVWFQPYQLAGPYDVWASDPAPILYSMTTVPLFLAFSVLPAVLWWAIPIGGTLAIVAWHRPPWQTWPLLVGLALFPTTVVTVGWTGNPTLWIMFAVALATRWPAFGPLVALKPTLAPFALIGIRHRAWWVVAVGLGLVSLPFLANYARVLLNAQEPRGILYSLNHAVPLLIPVVAWLSHLVPGDLRGLVARARVQADVPLDGGGRRTAVARDADLQRRG